MFGINFSANGRYSPCASSKSNAIRLGRDANVQFAQNASGQSFGPPGVLLKLGIGSFASCMSRLARS